MKHEVLAINPTPVGVYRDPEHRRHREAALALTRELPTSFDDQGVKRFGDEGCILSQQASLVELKSWIEEAAQHFAAQVLRYRVDSGMVLTGSWLNQTAESGTQSAHMHVNALISGTYYVKRKSCHSPLVFFRPEFMGWPTRPSIHAEYSGQTSFNGHGAVQPQEGDLLLWSSEVLHGYPASGANGRVSLSMNFMPREISHLYGYKVEALDR